jgi:hypothetical protein
MPAAMISPLPFGVMDSVDSIPQAVIGRPVSHFRNNMNIPFINGHDDLVEYEGAVLELNKRLPFALNHYRGHPRDTITIYLPVDLRDLGKITETILMIMKELRLTRDALIWQRADNPDL